MYNSACEKSLDQGTYMPLMNCTLCVGVQVVDGARKSYQEILLPTFAFGDAPTVRASHGGGLTLGMANAPPSMLSVQSHARERSCVQRIQRRDAVQSRHR